MKNEFKNYSEFEEAKALCRECPIGPVYDKVVLSVGNKKDPIVAVIGEAPGKDEVEQGEPFIGKSGQLLRKVLNANGFSRENTIITNTIPCRPLNNKFPSDKSIVQGCIERWLAKEIMILKPEYLLLIGGKPLGHILGLTGITKSRGTWLPWASPLDPSFRANVMATFHPSYVLRKQYESEGASIRNTFEADIREVAKTAGILST